MNEMYGAGLDRFGGVTEPPDDYYFRPRWETEPEEDENDDE